MTNLRQNTNRPTGALASLNDPSDHFKNPSQVEYLRALKSNIAGALDNAVSIDQAVPHVHLQSPDGKTYKITVGSDGTVQSEYING